MKQIGLYLTLLLILVGLASCQSDRPPEENTSNMSDVTTDAATFIESDDPVPTVSIEDPTDSSETPTDEIEVPTGMSTEEPTDKKEDPTDKPEDPTDKPEDPTDKLEDPTDKPENPTDKPEEPTQIPVEPQPGEIIVYASELEWLSATCHSSQPAPAVNQAFDRNGALIVDGVTYEKGIGTHGCDAGQPDGEIVMNIPATASRFRAVVGLDDRMCPDSGNGTVEFIVLLDGVEAARSGILTATSPAYVFDVDVSDYDVITLRLTNGGDSAAYDAADWCWAYFVVDEAPEESTEEPTEELTEEPTDDPDEPVEPQPEETIVYVSDMEWISATCHGSQPAPAVNQAFDRNGALTVDGVTYEKGFGTHGCDAGQPDGEIVMSIPENAIRFHAVVGLDDRMCPDSGNGTVEFVILLDGVEAARSGILTATSPAYVFDVDVSGASVITLRLTNGGDSAAYDGADWCDAYFTVIA